MKRPTLQFLIGSRHRAGAACRTLPGPSTGSSAQESSTRVLVQRDPTPTEASAQIAAQPTSTPALDQVAIPPSPTPPSSVQITPTTGSLIVPPTETSTPERVPREPTETATAEAQIPEPTATQPVITQPEPEGDHEQQFPCGTPWNPFGWLCWPGPGGPWFPVFPSRDVSEATSIHWYGVRMTDPLAVDSWGMESVAWTLDGREVSRCTMESDGSSYLWTLADAETRLAGEFSVETDTAGRSQFVGSVNGQSYVLPFGEGTRFVDEGSPLELDPAQGVLVVQWTPLFHDVAGLLDIAAPRDGGAVAGPGKCAVAGGLTAVGCLATASTLLFGHFVCDDIMGYALDWCQD